MVMILRLCFGMEEPQQHKLFHQFTHIHDLLVKHKSPAKKEEKLCCATFAAEAFSHEKTNKPQPCSHFQLVWSSLLWVPSANDITLDYQQITAFQLVYSYHMLQNHE